MTDHEATIVMLETIHLELSELPADKVVLDYLYRVNLLRDINFMYAALGDVEEPNEYFELCATMGEMI